MPAAATPAKAEFDRERPRRLLGVGGAGEGVRPISVSLGSPAGVCGSDMLLRDRDGLRE